MKETQLGATGFPQGVGPLRFVHLLVWLFVLSSTPTLGAGPDDFTPAGSPLAEVAIDDGLVAALLEVRTGSSLYVPDWPVAPGVRDGVWLARHDVYAADARIWKVEGGKWTEIPRSKLAFFWGPVDGLDDRMVVAWIDPDRRMLQAVSESPDGGYLLHPLAPDRAEGYVQIRLDAPARFSGSPGVAECRPPLAPGDPAVDLFAPAPEGAIAGEAIQWPHTATVAVDTDNELMLQKFGDDTSAATDYIAELLALVTSHYERDLRMRLLQGTTYLRVSSSPDPYAQSPDANGSATSAQLIELRDYWRTNYAAVSRALAIMLSGKQPSANNASGISYVDVLCSLAYGYSFNQVFKFAGSDAADDAFLVGHELGHGFGSLHTHCYLDPEPIDACYNLESGCYSGIKSCPQAQTINGVPNVTGTWMSYCHLLTGCTASKVFHPRTVEILDPKVQAKVGVCVFPSGTPQEASPGGEIRVAKGTGTALAVNYEPACGASQHTVYKGDLATLGSGIAWSGRHCAFDNSGALSFDPGSEGSIYFVVVGNSGTAEGSYGKSSGGAERPAAGPGGACSYSQVLTGSCP